MIKEIPCKSNHYLIGFEEIPGGYCPIFKRVKPIGTLVKYRDSDCKQVGPICIEKFQIENTALVISDELMITYDGRITELYGKTFDPNTKLPEFLSHLKELGIFWNGCKLHVSYNFSKNIKLFCESEYTLNDLKNLIENYERDKSK